MAENRIEILVKAEVARALTELEKVKKAPKGIIAEFNQMFGGVKAGWLAVAGVLSGAVAGALGMVTKKGIEFLDLNDDFNAFFRGIEANANDARNALVNGFGFSTQGATKLLLSIGQIADNMGLAKGESLEFAKRIGELSAAWQDMNPNGKKAAEISEIFGMALQGNYRGLRQLGIALSDSEEQQLKNAESMDASSRSHVVLELLTNKSTLAMKEFSAQGGSLSERIARTTSLMDDLQVAIGSAIALKIDEFASQFNNFQQAGDRMAYFRAKAKDVLDVVIAVIGLAFIPLETTLRGLIAGIIGAGKSLSILGGAFKELKKGNFTEALNSSEDALEQLGQTLLDVGKAPIDTFKANYNRLKDAFQETKVEIVKNTNPALASVRNSISQVGESAEKAADRVKKANELIKKSNELNSQIALFLAKDETEKKGVELIKQRDMALAANAERLLIEKDALDQKEEINRKYEENVTEFAKQENIKRAQDILSSINTISSAVSGAVTAYGTLITTQAEQDLAYITRISDEQLAKGEITQQEHDKRIADAKEKQRIAMTDQANIQKAASITQATIATAQAIVQALTLGPIAGPIMAGIIGAMGAAQIAFMAATPIPAFAEGGIVNGPQTILAGERGREAVLPNDLTELLLSAAGQGGGGGNTYHFTVMANDPISMTNQIKRRYGKAILQ